MLSTIPAGSTTSTCGVVPKAKSDRYHSRQLSISSGLIDCATWSIRVSGPAGASPTASNSISHTRPSSLAASVK